MKRKTTEEFIKEASIVHNNKYNYSKVVYTNKRNPVEIICPIHGSFIQSPEVHLKGSGCPKCGKEIAISKKRFSKKEIIKQFKEAHGDKYDYSKMEYKNIDTPVEIICPIHGSFWQSPYEHRKGSGCPKCYGLNKTTEEFIKEAEKIHGKIYNYSKVEYKSAKDPVEIICPIHGSFWQIPNNHLNGSGCPICSSSKGEELIRSYLIENKINFETQKKFDGCKDVLPLPFDFYINNKKIAIEFDGIQHYRPIDFSGNRSKEEVEKNFKTIKKHDEIKTNYCVKNNIKLIRISYEEIKEISKILCFLSKSKKGTFIMKWDKNFNKEEYAKNILESLKDFPFDTYSKEELMDDYNKISAAPKSLKGLKLVRQFHPNIYKSRVNNKISPFEAWDDKEILYKTILNRMKYVRPPYTPKIIRDGLNISKVACKVSVFKPCLAYYIASKYLSGINEVFDPFSGFSGRMLGICSSEKKYIGQDINKEAVLGSNEIINLLKLNANVVQKDLFESSGKYESLMTCSPYGLKETWGDDIKNLSCDEWIDECLKRFECKKYIFVVDDSIKYRKYIKENFSNKSHFGTNFEKLIVIEK